MSWKGLGKCAYFTYLKDETVECKRMIVFKDFNKGTYISRVPQCLSPRPNWDPPPPLPPASVSPLESGGETLACGWGGGGGPNSDDWRKSLAPCLLCAHWKKGVDGRRSHSSHSFALPYFPSNLCFNFFLMTKFTVLLHRGLQYFIQWQKMG